ncbi:uncharacterized protein LOC129287528 [Prosopis cineraria]|uniref:uncharacterized protein LOC129287528 n=1 Tax=Prosopis cineraria TaxID=364024 RepID=UPI00240F4B24|nr:uncharacterized protein LOC129287528 [Prosopis cineraria]
MDVKRPRKLDLNKPLLSTKRLSIVVADTSCSSTSVGKTVQNNTSEERVPFSWEKAAGKPKDADDHNEEETPRLRLPPCLWHSPNQEPEADEADMGDDHHRDEGCVDDGSSGGGGDDEEKFDSDFLSDAMEVFSLSEALDIVQKSEKARRKSANEGLRLRLEEESNNGNESPNYLIKRFLPDATALAASSTLHFSKSMMDKKICDSSSSYLEAYVASPKGCGLEVLFPWRLKHKLCAMKSPVLPCSGTSMQKQHQNRRKVRRSAHKDCTKCEDN